MKVEQREKLDGFNEDGELVTDRKKMEGSCSNRPKPTAGCSASGRRRSRRAVSRERCGSSRSSCKFEGNLALRAVVLRTIQLHVSAL
jgi:hypothetical protein